MNKSVYKHGSYYCIYHKVDGFFRFYGKFETLKQADEYADMLESKGWDAKFIQKAEANKPFESKKGRILEPPHVSIYENKGKYNLIRSFNKKVILYGVYMTYDEAIEKRDYFEKNEWNLDLRDSGIEKEKLKLPTNIYVTVSGRYGIHKSKNGKNKHYGVYSTVEEAIEAKRVLIENDWNLD